MSSSDHDNSTEHEVEERIFTTSAAEVWPIKKNYRVGIAVGTPIFAGLIGWAMFYMGMMNWFFIMGGIILFIGFMGYFMYFLTGVESVTLSSRGIKISKRWKTLTYTWDQIKQTVHLGGQAITLILTEDGSYWTSDLKYHVTINDAGFSTDDWKKLEEIIRNTEMPHHDQHVPSGSGGGL